VCPELQSGDWKASLHALRQEQVKIAFPVADSPSDLTVREVVAACAAPDGQRLRFDAEDSCGFLPRKKCVVGACVHGLLIVS